jgi:hypothetical protein
MGVAEVKERVQRILTEKGTIEVDGDGDFTFASGSTRTFIHVHELSDGSTAVLVWAPVLMDPTPSPELFEYVATEGSRWVFGRLALKRYDSGSSQLLFEHSILGDYLDPEELHWAVGAVANTADDLDDELQPKFGGRKFSDT